MTRQILPYFNASEYGEGLEGTVNYANILNNYLLLPTFLFVVYILALYVWSKGNHKMGGGVIFISLIMFIISIIAQTFTLFNQIVIFIFFIGIIGGVIIHIIEG